MSLFRAAATVSSLTLLSRITGLVREQIGAALFGTSAMMDAFQIAFRIPNLLRRLFAEGAFAQAFVPLLAATRASQGDDATRDLVDAVATVLAWALLATCVLGISAQFVEGTKPAPTYEWGRTVGIVLVVIIAIWAAVSKKDAVDRVAQHAIEHE